MGNRDRQSKETKKPKKDTKIATKTFVQPAPQVTVLKTKGKKQEGQF